MVSLRSLRGHVVLLTFLYSHCRELCPTEAASLAQLERTVPPSERPTLVVVSVDPRRDTATSVQRFAANAGWVGPWHWLLGTRAALRRVWRAYGIDVRPGATLAHSGALYLIDRRGYERSGYVAPFLEQGPEHDLRLLAASPSQTLAVALLVAACALALASAATLTHARLAPQRALIVGRRRWSRLLLVIVGMAAAGIVAALLLRPSNAAVSASGALITPKARSAAPSFTSATPLHGAPPQRARRGRILFVNFWASWCDPCRREAPALEAFAASLPRDRAALVGVDEADQRGDALAFIRRYKLTYPMLSDPTRRVGRAYALLGLPTTVAIDQKGRIAVELLGPQTSATLRAIYQRLEHSTRS